MPIGAMGETGAEGTCWARFSCESVLNYGKRPTQPQRSLYWAWTFASLNIITLGLGFLGRFQAGK